MYLVTSEVYCTRTALIVPPSVRLTLCSSTHTTEVPKLHYLVRASTHKTLSVRGEGNTVDAIPVPAQPLHQLSSRDIPNAHDRVHAPSSDVLTIRTDGNRSDTSIWVVIIDSKNFRGSVNHIPNPDGFIARSRNDKPPIGGEIKRVDFLLVTIKNVADALLCDIPDLGHTSVRSQETLETRWRTRRRLSSAPVARYLLSGLKQTLRIYRSPAFPAVSSTSTLVHFSVSRGNDWSIWNSRPSLLASFGIVDLRRPVTPCSEILSIGRESNTTDDTGDTSIRILTIPQQNKE